jgi:asparagine synthase (glutamine-hydrolysing)
MCGIAGLWTREQRAGGPDFVTAIRRMAAQLVRRGPDDEGFWSDPGGRLQLGFRRLAIIDPSPAGHQPMISGDGRSVLIMNGEIYNYRELGRELESAGVALRSKSDTEVLLEGLNRWGLDLVPRLNGMFAFAWYRIPEGELALVRDHAGIKPLYWFAPPDGSGLAFGSQYDILLRTPLGDPGPVRLDVLHLYLRLQHIPPPFGLLENTHQLAPGHWLRVGPGRPSEQRAWWTLPRSPEPELAGEGALEPLAAALDRSVRRQRIADVPLGVFLSGGVDSPLVTAVARAQAGAALKAFTIGSPGWAQDESEDARAYGRNLDVDFRLHPVTGKEALEAMAEVGKAQHEPFADFSILPTMLVSRFAREEVTVSLSGDGGDELFFGYERPVSLLKSGSLFRFPRPVRRALHGAGRLGIGPRRNDAVVAKDPGAYYFGVNEHMDGDELRRLAPCLSRLPEDFHLYDFGDFRGTRDLANYSRYVEFYGQLQRGLKKVDMGSMHHSLEVRVPLLDREVIDVSLRIDPFTCMRNGTRKAPLRDLLARSVPPETIPTPKRGFAVPLGDWLRGPLRPLVEETLLGVDLFPSGVFDRAAVKEYWEGHLRGENRKWGIWTLLALQLWAREHARPSSGS